MPVRGDWGGDECTDMDLKNGNCYRGEGVTGINQGPEHIHMLGSQGIGQQLTSLLLVYLINWTYEKPPVECDRVTGAV